MYRRLRLWKSPRCTGSLQSTSCSLPLRISSHTRLVLFCRHNSSKSSPESPSLDHYAITQKPRPFAVEHVDGREQHLSWSPQGGIRKEWRETEDEGVQSTDGSNAVSTVSSCTGRITSWFRQMFFPTNYPHSVHPSYFPYHVLQFFETTLGTLVSVLCNQALLTSVGVSAEGSIFGAVAVQWIIKDGAGEVAKLFFIRRFSPYFDSHPKTFNLLGESIVALGSGLQIATLLVSPSTTNFLICAAGGNIFKLVGNAIWFTTHIKFVRYFSSQHNTGDVAAKEESQASIAQLVGYSLGIGLLTFSHSAAYLYSIFFLAVPVHLSVTAWMLRVAKFELLTVPRMGLLASWYVRQKCVEEGDVEKVTEAEKGIVGLDEMEERKMPGLFGEFYKRKEDRFMALTPRLEDTIKSDSVEERIRWETCVEVFNDEKYLLYPSSSTSDIELISIFYDPSTTTDDTLRSILHAAHLRQLLTSSTPPPSMHDALKQSLDWAQQNFADFKFELEQHGWKTDEIGFADHGRRVTWRTKDY